MEAVIHRYEASGGTVAILVFAGQYSMSDYGGIDVNMRSQCLGWRGAGFAPATQPAAASRMRFPHPATQPQSTSVYYYRRCVFVCV